jgi:hypothetical protein
VQFEIRRSINCPRRQLLDAFSFALYEHGLERGHASMTVIPVQHPVADVRPELCKTLISAGHKFPKSRFMCLTKLVPIFKPLSGENKL